MAARFAMTDIPTYIFTIAAGLALTSAAAAADVQPSVTLTLKNHRFTPATFSVPAGRRVRITLINRDPATEEFDSHALRLEEVVTPMGKISFDIGPLTPGRYSFMGEFHAETAQGEVIAVAAGH